MAEPIRTEQDGEISTLHEDLGIMTIEEECRECGGTGTRTKHGNLIITIAGREAVSEAGFCSSCYGVGRIFWAMNAGEIVDLDVTRERMSSMCDEWWGPKIESIMDRIAAGERRETRVVG